MLGVRPAWQAAHDCSAQAAEGQSGNVQFDTHWHTLPQLESGNSNARAKRVRRDGTFWYRANTCADYTGVLELGPKPVHVLSMDPYVKPPTEPARSEPMFKVPFVPLIVAGGLVALYASQSGLPYGGMGLALVPVDVSNGYVRGLVTHMLVHGSWMHVIMNALAVLAFGTPVARAFNKPLGALGWLLFFIVCGVIGGLGYTLIKWGSLTPVVGASGAAFGMIGASLRLMAGAGIMIPLFHPVVLRGAAVWMGVNLLTGLLGGFITGEGGGIAWEAHAFGFVAGLLLIGPFYRLFSRYDGRTLVK